MSAVPDWMIYGANGYTGRLVARLAVARGERPVLAGRNADEVAALAGELGLEHRVVDLPTGRRGTAALQAALDGIGAVAHCAGPYQVTAAPMVDACLAAGTHYLDITGELPVFEEIYERHDEAVAAGVVLLPGAGFDVVPTDCLAALLAAQLPGAVSLELAFLARGGMSPGTAKTALGVAGRGGRRRVGGQLVPTRYGEPSRVVPFPSGERRVGAVPWGDVVTAYRSTGIGDITVYTKVPASMAGPGRVARLRTALVQKLLGYRVIHDIASRMVGARVAGPSPDTREATGVEVWGEVRDAAGGSRSGTLVGPNGYDLTADAVVRAAGYVLAGRGPAGPIAPGAHTPSSALGADFARELTGVTLELG